jgi:hypothetical protein
MAVTISLPWCGIGSGFPTRIDRIVHALVEWSATSTPPAARLFRLYHFYAALPRRRSKASRDSRFRPERALNNFYLDFSAIRRHFFETFDIIETFTFSVFLINLRW